MYQQTPTFKPRKNMKKLLAELASRQLNWTEQKTKEIINSQRGGYSNSSSSRADLITNHKELPSVKSANQSAKHIQFKVQNKPRTNTSNFSQKRITAMKRFATEMVHDKENVVLDGKLFQNQTESLKIERELFLPKISSELNKKKSFESAKGELLKGVDLGLQIIEQQQQSTIKKEQFRNVHKMNEKGL